MLILSRTRDQQVIIGNEMVTITVVDIRGDRVRLGFTASKEVPIHRKEVYDAIQKDSQKPNGEVSNE
jgi:carbon storage regulator